MDPLEHHQISVGIMNLVIFWFGVELSCLGTNDQRRDREGYLIRTMREGWDKVKTEAG